MNKILHRAKERGHADHGWLNTYHSFSFAQWYDPSKVHFGMLRVLNDDMIGGGMGFGKHPHDNMEIITIVLEGSLEHKDSMGHTQAINPGEVQVMSAGSGIQHSEYNHESDKTTSLFQIWIFPDKKNVKPRYDQKFFPERERNNVFQQVVAPIGSEGGALGIHQDAWISRISMDEGLTREYELHSTSHGAYIMVVEGAAQVAGEQLARRDAIGISDARNIAITASANCELLVIEVPM